MVSKYRVERTMRWFVETTEETYVVREANPLDQWDAGDRDGSVTGVVARQYETEYDSGYETCPKFAVVVGYQTGSTFGTDFSSTVVDCFDEEEPALELAAEIDRLYSDPRISTHGFTWNDKEYYSPWTGYFERIQSIDVFPIENNTGRRYRY